MTTTNDQRALEMLDARIKTLLPEEYRDSYDDMQPTPMGSAAMKYDDAGQAAWDQMWGSFCDLAMAGGPPHKGTLLGPGVEAEIDAQFGLYDEVAEEICRGIKMVTGLRAYVSSVPGWVSITCLSDAMAGWLLRAIVMENVAVRCRGSILELPAAPHFRLEKEIKNVITVIAKTCHYWLGHMSADHQRAVAELFMTIARESPLIEPDLSSAVRADNSRRSSVAALIARDTGLRRADQQYPGWLGVECPNVRAAVWLMRALVASNVLSRREGTTLFVPVNAAADPHGTIVSDAVARIYQYARSRGVLGPRLL